MAFDTIDWDPSVTDGIAAYDGFRAAAAEAAEGDFPSMLPLADGGLFALRLDAVTPSAIPPLDAVRADVAAAWRADATARRLAARAEALAADPTPDLAEPPRIVPGVVRDAPIEGLPAAVVDAIFAAEAGDVIAVPGDAERAFVVRVDAVAPADLAQGQAAELRRAIVSQAQVDLAGDLFEHYGRAVQARAGFTVNDAAVAAVQADLAGSR